MKKVFNNLNHTLARLGKWGKGPRYTGIKTKTKKCLTFEMFLGLRPLTPSHFVIFY